MLEPRPFSALFTYVSLVLLFLSAALTGFAGLLRRCPVSQVGGSANDPSGV